VKRSRCPLPYKALVIIRLSTGQSLYQWHVGNFYGGDRSGTARSESSVVTTFAQAFAQILSSLDLCYGWNHDRSNNLARLPFIELGCCRAIACEFHALNTVLMLQANQPLDLTALAKKPNVSPSTILTLTV
jgi:hypothetical protein